MVISVSNSVDSGVVYVVAVSGFNQPALEACLTRTPNALILITSNDSEIRKKGERLSRVLKECLPDMKVQLLDHPGDGLEAGSVEQAQRWIDRYLVPLLQKPPYAQQCHWLYATGGTKALMIVLTNVHPWDAIDYKAEGKNVLESMKLLQNRRFSEFSQTHLEDAKPEWVVRLHNDTININLLNCRIKEPGFAQSIWDALINRETGLIYWFQLLNTLWSLKRNEPVYNVRTLAVHTILEQSGVPFPNAEAECWFTRISSLAPKDWYKGEQAGQWFIPGNRPANSSDLRDWLSAVWLEQLAVQWLLEGGIPEENLKPNITVDREADLLVNYNGSMKLIECKADYIEANGNGKNEIRDIERQLSSIGQRFGSAKNAFLLGPEFSFRLQQHPKTQTYFDNLCKASKITILKSRDDLIKFVK